MQGGRSVPQSVQQKIIKQYCQENNLQFLLSATEFAGHTIMFDSIKEDVIVFYSIWLLPKEYKKREKIYQSGKDIRFAAECMHELDIKLLETVFKVGEWHENSRFREAVAYIKQTQLYGKNERRKT